MRRVLLADHAHETAQRYPVERVDRIPVPNAEDARREPEGELRYFDAEPLGRGEVAELVDEDQEAENRDYEQPAGKPKHLHPRYFRDALFAPRGRGDNVVYRGVFHGREVLERPLDHHRNIGEFDTSVQERRDGHFVRSVEDSRPRAAPLGDVDSQLEAWVPAGVQGLERQLTRRYGVEL